MKKLVSLLLLAVFSVTVSAQIAKIVESPSGRDIYNKYSDDKGVSAVYISKSMFNLMGKLPAVEMNDEDINLSELVKSLDGFYLLEFSNDNAVRQSLLNDVKKFVKADNYETLMEIKDDDGENVRIYIRSLGDDVKGLVMMISDDESSTFIFIDGKISRENLEKILSSVDYSEIR